MAKNKSGVDRREALRWLIGTPLHLGLLPAAVAGSQLSPPRNLRIEPATTAGSPQVAPDSPIARNLYPRTFLTPSSVAALRAQLTGDVRFRERWQTAIQQFEGASGTWLKTPNDAYANAFAAFLTC